MKLDTEETGVFEPLLVRLAGLAPVRAWLEQRYRRRMRGNREHNLYCGRHESFAAALAAIDRDVAPGYDNSASAALYRDRLKRVFPSDYPAMLWLGKCFDAGCRRVFDLGGHIGVAYYAYQRYLAFPPGLEWTVLDVPVVAAAGREHAAANDSARRLGFAAGFAEAEGRDLLFASGSLQYLEPTLAELLGTLAQLPRRVIVNLLPLHPSESFHTVQGIATAISPYRVQREGEFVGSLRALGYQVLDRWDNAEKACRIYLRPELSLDRYAGFCLARD